MQNTKHNVINNETIEIQAGSELKIETILYENVTQDATALLNLFFQFSSNTKLCCNRAHSTEHQGAGVGMEPWRNLSNKTLI